MRPYSGNRKSGTPSVDHYPRITHDVERLEQLHILRVRLSKIRDESCKAFISDVISRIEKELSDFQPKEETSLKLDLKIRVCLSRPDKLSDLTGQTDIVMKVTSNNLNFYFKLSPEDLAISLYHNCDTRSTILIEDWTQPVEIRAE